MIQGCSLGAIQHIHENADSAPNMKATSLSVPAPNLKPKSRTPKLTRKETPHSRASRRNNKEPISRHARRALLVLGVQRIEQRAGDEVLRPDERGGPYEEASAHPCYAEARELGRYYYEEVEAAGREKS